MVLPCLFAKVLKALCMVLCPLLSSQLYRPHADPHMQTPGLELYGCRVLICFNKIYLVLPYVGKGRAEIGKGPGYVNKSTLHCLSVLTFSVYNGLLLSYFSQKG